MRCWATIIVGTWRNGDMSCGEMVKMYNQREANRAI